MLDEFSLQIFIKPESSTIVCIFLCIKETRRSFMKGIVLAGGSGTLRNPLTMVTSK